MFCALGVHCPTAPVIFQHGACTCTWLFLKFHPRSTVASTILNWKQYTSDLSSLFDSWNCQIKQATSKLRSLLFRATPKICIAGSWPTKKTAPVKTLVPLCVLEVFLLYFSCLLTYCLCISVPIPCSAFCSSLSESSSSLQCQFLLPLHVPSNAQSHSPN